MRRPASVRTCLLAAAAACAAAPPLPAAEITEMPDSTATDRTAVSVTVYNVGLGLVRETRVLRDVPHGVAALRFMDVPSRINPRTVHLASLDDPGGLVVLEQNYEFDLISPQKLMEKYVGREVEIVEQAEDLTTRSVRATLLSVNGGPVYRIGDRIVLNQTGKVTLPDVPPDLVPRPTLVWTIRNERAREHRVEASYLTDGMTWSADYVAVIAEDDASLGLTGWVTIDNRSGATFRDATLKLVAGDVRRVSARGVPMEESVATDRMRKAAAPQFAEESFFEYHLYTLGRPTTVKDNQTKQISLLQAERVPVSKTLLIRGQPWWFRNQRGTLTRDQKAEVVLRFDNTKKVGLGVPLPKGTIRVYKKDRSGAEQFVGEDAIDHTPRDETIRLHVGDAFDVVASQTQTDYDALSPRMSESAYEVVIRNHKDEDVTVTVREPVGGDWTLIRASHEGRKRDAGTLEFEIPVPANGQATLTYRVRVRW
ncbi:MAG: DUF4139 domain-containing protein [Acidobacteria bacterium]|nr:MAG: DUF4139 domain-containing protein [Acidobacteriota bacterium]